MVRFLFATEKKKSTKFSILSPSERGVAVHPVTVESANISPSQTDELVMVSSR